VNEDEDAPMIVVWSQLLIKFNVWSSIAVVGTLTAEVI
jgi:hypothetical protein